MPFSDAQFARTRPFLFHLTDRGNLKEIGSSRTLHSAASLMQKAGATSFLRQRRAKSMQVQLAAITISIRDQEPLYAGNISLLGGWSFEDVVQSLNERIFFWPGSHSGLIGHGQRHFARYLSEKPAILRVSTADLYRANSGVSPLYCRYNSGSPRCTYGKGSPRGPSTFVSCADADYGPSKVVEVTYREHVTLPPLVEVGDSTFGPWRKL
jgi:hypothetical protein